MNTEQSPFEKFGRWLKQSVGLKLSTITILMLLLLIPASMIKSIIHERESLNKSVLHEVSSKWANEQQINGPILTIPLVYEYLNNKNEIIKQTKLLHILPDQLNVNGNIEPKTLKRGIYEVVVYLSKLNIAGKFDLNAKIDQSGLKEIQFDKAFISIGISDLRGIEDQVQLQWGKEKISVQPGSRLPNMMPSGVSLDVPNLAEDFTKMVDFSFDLNLQGSQNLSFIPVGGSTQVELQSPWPSPSFNGNFIPKTREVSDQALQPSGKLYCLTETTLNHVDRNMADRMQESSFGVDLIMPLDDYQKATRSAKYAAMTISLIFLVFFLVEILNGKKIHPFQYTLVGLALCLFYVLLISISEHTNFNIAYLISAGVSSLLISLYSTSVFKSLKFTAILSSTILGIYTFLFVTLQLADYALLMGSIGLTVILAITMFFTRNINWYKLHVSAE
ncbi:cell envelope integrity protein CreD [Marinifilum fragile]|uniref:cell envelope integrity protein CreD n=1 Tax=Marinifilum fragile TaxID=570161 RepID=UPI0006D27A89|nr:cell envelope integrity protein CreD [Marinifilum fragile]